MHIDKKIRCVRVHPLNYSALSQRGLLHVEQLSQLMTDIGRMTDSNYIEAIQRWSAICRM